MRSFSRRRFAQKMCTPISSMVVLFLAFYLPISFAPGPATLYEASTVNPVDAYNAQLSSSAKHLGISLLSGVGLDLETLSAAYAEYATLYHDVEAQAATVLSPQNLEHQYEVSTAALSWDNLSRTERASEFAVTNAALSALDARTPAEVMDRVYVLIKSSEDDFAGFLRSAQNSL